MHIIFLSRHHGAARSVHLQPRLLMLAGACVVGASLLAGGFMGAWLFRAPAPVAGIEVDAALQAQSAEISSAREDAQRQMDALSVHLGELQARLVRLDALGERLTELADVDPDEFDFSLSVGQGGVDEPLEGSAYAPPSFMATLDELAARLDTREQQLEVLEQLLADKHISQSTYLAGQPVRQGYISSPFGRRVNPVSGRLSMHKGIDFAAPAGSDVVAVAAGVVTWSGRKNGYGNVVEVGHADGYTTLYAHNQKNLVEVGDLVKRRQVLAKVGSTGRSTGYHVHFEVMKDGRVMNPQSFIARASVSE